MVDKVVMLEQIKIAVVCFHVMNGLLFNDPPPVYIILNIFKMSDCVDHDNIM